MLKSAEQKAGALAEHEEEDAEDEQDGADPAQPDQPLDHAFAHQLPASPLGRQADDDGERRSTRGGRALELGRRSWGVSVHSSVLVALSYFLGSGT